MFSKMSNALLYVCWGGGGGGGGGGGEGEVGETDPSL